MDENQTQSTTTTDQNEIEELRNQLEVMTETAKRALADLQNTKRRSEEDRLAIYPSAQSDLVKELLPVFISLDLALNQIPANLATENWVLGIQQIGKLIDNILAKIGIQEINPLNEDFNPLEHEAMLEVAGEKNKIIQVFEKGYKLKEKIIKPAKVSVGKD